MQTITLRAGEPLVIHGVPAPTLRVQVVDAIRVWVDRRGKTHCDFERARPTRAPARCAHVGTFRVGGRMVAYTWSRGAALGLRCGDCGMVLE